MPSCHLLVPSTLALALTLTSACNPEVNAPVARDADSTGAGTTINNATGSTGGGDAMDGGEAGGAVAASPDAGSGDIDAAHGDSGAGSVGAAGDGGDADGGGATDAGGGAAARPDAGGDGGVPCTINDPRFGCGTRLSVDWIHFASGLDIDTKYGRAWSPVIKASSLQSVVSSCAALVVNRLSNFEAPEIDDVRTLAAGCAATLPNGSCDVQSGVVLPSESGSCSCASGAGPNQGKFCRPELPECETLWTVTECGPVNAECATARSWFYDVQTGSLVLAALGEPIAQQAKARCVAPFNNYREP